MPHIMSTFIVEILKKEKYTIQLPPNTFIFLIIGAPLFSASFHFKVILTSFVSAGKSVISTAAGTPGLKDEWYKAKKC